MNKFNTPILFIVFNRPEITKKSFTKIRQIKPSKLYVACDGPREGFENEKRNVNEVQKIATTIDWPCEVKTLFQKNNLGCRKGCITAINWFFDNEEKGIILEDDCLAHLDFFYFCENLLDRYNSDERVSFISGDNFQNGNLRGEASYYFSKYISIWGWATWKNKWKKYDVGNMKFWPNWKSSRDFLDKIPYKVERKYWGNIFNLMYLGKIDTWDYALTASVWHKGGLTATPNVNLISNIGFGEGATHTTDKYNKNSMMPVQSIGELKHPKKVERNIKADEWSFSHHYGGKNLSFPNNFIFYFKKLINYFFKDSSIK